MASSVESQEQETKNGEAAESPRPKRRIAVFAVLGVVLIAAAVGGYKYLHYASAHESTDDAQIDGHIHAVSSRVGGSVVKMHVKNNDWVEAGAVLVEID